jgi:glycosyltransferase involved in cell wall biosynthesis
VQENSTAQKLSILFINFTHLDLSINKSATTDIITQFSKMGYNASLITARSNSTPQLANYRGRLILVPLKRLPLVIPAMYTFLISLFLPFYLIFNKPDFVVIEPGVHVLSVFSTLVLSKIKKIKWVLDVRTIPVETIGLHGYLDKLWFSTSIYIAKKLFDGLTIITPLMKNEICANFYIDSSKVGVWTSGVASDLFNPNINCFKTMALRKKLGLSGKFVVFYHGVFTASRGLDQTIEAISLLYLKYPEIVFLLLGDGPDIDRLKTLIVARGLEKNVVIHNKVEQQEVPAFINLSDIGIVPLPYNKYWRFQSPLKLLEYLSMQKVVIVSDIPAHRLVVNNKQCAIFLKSVIPSEIAKCIEYAYRNRGELEDWGVIGREIVLKEFVWEKVAMDLEKYLKSLYRLKE